jgi:hypothetical protein
MAEKPGLPTRSGQHLPLKSIRASGATLQTGMPVFRSAPTGQGGCRSTARFVLSLGKFGRSGLYALGGNAVLWISFLPINGRIVLRLPLEDTSEPSDDAGRG